MKSKLFAACFGLALLAGAACLGPAKAATVGPVTDPLGVVRIPKGAPIEIGGYWVLSGPDTALGLDEQRGVEVAIHDMGGKLLGHPIQFHPEDDQCTAEGGQTAATKLASIPNMVIVIGPACSSAATPAAPILWQAGITDIGTASTAPSLTAPNRPKGFYGFARTIFSDNDQGASDANYLYKVMKFRTAVAIQDGSPYADQLAHVFAAAFTKLGGKVFSIEGVTPTEVDMHPVLTRIASEKPDVVYMPIFVAAAAQILRQSKQVPGLQHTMIYGGGALMAPDMIEAAGPSIVGFHIGYPDISPKALGKTYPHLLAEYKKMFGEAPISGYHANAYDAAVLAFKAIKEVAKTDAAGNLYIGKMALRNAVFATKFEGASGPIACNPYGECAKFKPAVYEFTNANPKTFKIGVNPKRIWP
ncbi:MAG: branched-chain amino acid ABC transporter substrate-binding protein [Rhodospirillales bacterium]|nr:branched-chain amino acid ABC transporter substrate-binding protein [Rhodospirillales bacterium]